MANILVSIEHGVEVGAEDVLKFLTGAEKTASEVATASPAALAGLGTILGAVGAAVTATDAAAASGGLNLALDAAALASIKAVWPDIVAFGATLGIKL